MRAVTLFLLAAVAVLGVSVSATQVGAGASADEQFDLQSGMSMLKDAATKHMGESGGNGFPLVEKVTNMFGGGALSDHIKSIHSALSGVKALSMFGKKLSRGAERNGQEDTKQAEIESKEWEAADERKGDSIKHAGELGEDMVKPLACQSNHVKKPKPEDEVDKAIAVAEEATKKRIEDAKLKAERAALEFKPEPDHHWGMTKKEKGLVVKKRLTAKKDWDERRDPNDRFGSKYVDEFSTTDKYAPSYRRERIFPKRPKNNRLPRNRNRRLVPKKINNRLKGEWKAATNSRLGGPMDARAPSKDRLPAPKDIDLTIKVPERTRPDVPFGAVDPAPPKDARMAVIDHINSQIGHLVAGGVPANFWPAVTQVTERCRYCHVLVDATVDASPTTTAGTYCPAQPFPSLCVSVASAVQSSLTNFLMARDAASSSKPYPHFTRLFKRDKKHVCKVICTKDKKE